MSFSVVPPVRAGSPWTLLSTATPSAATSTVFSSIDTSTYKLFKIVFEELDASTSQNLTLAIGSATDGHCYGFGGSLQSGAATVTSDKAVAGNAAFASGAANIQLTSTAASRQFKDNLRGEILIWELGSATATHVEGELYYRDSTGYVQFCEVLGCQARPTAYTSLTIACSTGNYTGTIYLYGATFL